MRVLVVFESIWGNTRTLAEAMARALEGTCTVSLVDSDTAPVRVEGYDLVIVGGPTHAFSMSRPSTRQAAAKRDAGAHPAARGIREWLDELEPITTDTPAAAFDTRVAAPRLPGSAAKAIRHELRSRGFQVSARPKSFHVHDYEGPLVEGEVERAQAWALGIRDVVVPAGSTP